MTVTPQNSSMANRDSQQRSIKNSKDITYDKSLRDDLQLARQLTITSSSSCVNRDVRDRAVSTSVMTCLSGSRMPKSPEDK